MGIANSGEVAHFIGIRRYTDGNESEGLVKGAGL
jgi:hypothetical protein